MEPDDSKTTVLVLDDDPFQHKLVSHQLSKEGLTVACFLRGAEALGFLDAHQSHKQILVLLDLEMPEMDGVEFVRHLTNRRFEGSLAFMSGKDRRILDSAALLATAHQLKFMGSLDKPVQSSSLGTVLDRWRKYESNIRRKKAKQYAPEEIRDAIANNRFVNYYQPKVEIQSGAVTGVESLARWQHPADGIVFPDQFIGVAEESNLIDDLTRTVLFNALKQMRAWQDQGLTLRVSVNVSMDNLKSVNFPDYVQSKIQRAGVDPDGLILEVTESRLMQDIRSSLDILTRLRLKNISLSIDDFGTGHSSLAQLRDLPFDELKIDRSFVHGAATNNTLRSILDASVTMASHLGMKAVAEGVENAEDWFFLRRHDCDLAQGYFIAKPMPAERIPAWISEWERRRHELCE